MKVFTYHDSAVCCGPVSLPLLWAGLPTSVVGWSPDRPTFSVTRPYDVGLRRTKNLKLDQRWPEMRAVLWDLVDKKTQDDSK